MTRVVGLRNVTRDDLSVFFDHQMDPEATEMAAFKARDRQTFMAHWTQILADETITARTILCDGQVAGNIVSFDLFGEREVGYWIGKDYWGKGIATAALLQFLGLVKTRPLYAHVAKGNVGSRRVLEKCGFTLAGTEGDELIFELSTR